MSMPEPLTQAVKRMESALTALTLELAPSIAADLRVVFKAVTSSIEETVARWTNTVERIEKESAYPRVEAIWVQSVGFHVPDKSQNLRILVKIVGEKNWRRVQEHHVPHGSIISHCSEGHAFDRWMEVEI